MTSTLERPDTIEPRRNPPHERGIITWLTTTDHKKIGIAYCVTAGIFFGLAGLLAMGIRAELATPGRDMVSRATYNQMFTIHGSAMLLLFLSPFIAGLANFIVPLQVGAPDMAFPRMNALSYWIFFGGGLCFFGGFLTVGGAGSAGWTGYAPLASQYTFPGTGMDLWLCGMLLTSIASMLTAVNITTTILLFRAPGMTMWRVAIFSWEMLIQSLLILLAFPAVALAMVLLIVDRQFGGNFYNVNAGGSAIMYQHLFWFFGHPEVYILILPAFGIITEVFATFSRKPIFGYRGLVLASIAIAGLSFGVWAHHMFTTGAISGPFFSFTTALIAVPTGVKFFNWLGTMWRGHVTYTTAMLFAIGFVANFLIGGVTGIMLASPTLDFHVHDTYFVVSHFHYVLSGGAMFAMFSALYYWFPKMTGKLLNEKAGKLAFWVLFAGFNLTFFPQYLVGLRGMPRRIVAYSPTDGFTFLNILSSAGAALMFIGVLIVLIDVITSWRNGRPAGDDPWRFGQTLEWATSSPPPHHNFHTLPPIRSERPAFDLHWGDKLAAKAETAATTLAVTPTAAGTTDEPASADAPPPGADGDAASADPNGAPADGAE